MPERACVRRATHNARYGLQYLLLFGRVTFMPDTHSMRAIAHILIYFIYPTASGPYSPHHGKLQLEGPQAPRRSLAFLCPHLHKFARQAVHRPAAWSPIAHTFC